MSRTLRAAALISGGGTTLENLFQRRDAGKLDLEIPLVLSSRAGVRGVEVGRAGGAKVQVIARRDYQDAAGFSAAIFDAARAAEVDLVLMAGFLAYAPIPADFAHRVMNIHPALIPAFCGRGMYGDRVHQAVLDYGAKVSGCTVHFVDDEYDHGPIILQRVVPVRDDDAVDALRARVNAVEAEAFPEAITLFTQGRLHVADRRVVVNRG